MPKVSQAHLDARRSQILDAAVVCFAREGFHRATMQDIVAQSKLSPGAIYNYFASKEEIIEAIADERHAREQAFIAEAQGASSVAAALLHLRDAFFSGLEDPEERRRRRVGIQLWAEAQRNPRILKLVRRGLDQPRTLLSALIAAGQRRKEIPRDLDPDATARFMIAAFHGFVLQLDWDSRAAVRPYIEVLDTVLRRVLAPVGQVGRRRSRGNGRGGRGPQHRLRRSHDHRGR
ncbi:MAG TPA: TetR/AcrR family transcriptional regulator [Candidatus Kryptonia bacterium]|nr:TetR/AcrR family transcriptional regulator [Candidatus Kryptonia bacterium]